LTAVPQRNHRKSLQTDAHTCYNEAAANAIDYFRLSFLTLRMPQGLCMANQAVERRLAAIVAADVVSYSRLMGVDTAAMAGANGETRFVTLIPDKEQRL